MCNIILFQPGYAHYRDELFSLLSKRHKIKFIYIRSTNTYPGKKQIEHLNHIFLDETYKYKIIGLLCLLLKYKPDVVISPGSKSVSTFISYLYSIIFAKKIIVWTLEWRKIYYNKISIKGFYKTIKFYLAKKIILNCDALVVGGSAAFNYALKLGKNPKNIFISVQSSHDIQHELTNNQSNHDSAHKYTFLYLGRIIKLKRLDLLIEAYAKLKKEIHHISLLVAGDGPFKGYCQRLCQKLKTKDVVFIGKVDPSKTYEIYNKAQIFILPSYFEDNNYESWGLVINEAMSMEMPVITTNAVGASFDMVINGYNGYIVQENSVSELYDAMKKIMYKDLNEMGVNSRRIYENKNSYEKMANGFTNAILHVKNLNE